MNRPRTAALIIGVLVCIPILLMHHFGLFLEVSKWFAALDARIFILQDTLRTSTVLQ